MALEPRLREILDGVRGSQGRVVALTGAGISAESGIPTFRGKEGYWVVGSRNYMPQEMATHAMFTIEPEEVWRWYLHRFGVVRHASPNAGHEALVRLERGLGERFTLVTQNIDGLHRRAGASDERTHCIHGDAAWIRCSHDCGVGRLPLPDLTVRDPRAPLSAEERARLTCPGAVAGCAPMSSGSTSATTRRTTDSIPRSAPRRRPTCSSWWERAAPPTSPCAWGSSASAGARRSST